MMSGYSVSLRSARIIEAVMRCVRWAKRWLQRVSRAGADGRTMVPSAIRLPRGSSPAVTIDMGTPLEQGSRLGCPAAMMRTDQGEMRPLGAAGRGFHGGGNHCDSLIDSCP